MAEQSDRRELSCACKDYCGDAYGVRYAEDIVDDSDDDGSTCKGLRRAPRKPLVEIVLVPKGAQP